MGYNGLIDPKSGFSCCCFSGPVPCPAGPPVAYKFSITAATVYKSITGFIDCRAALARRLQEATTTTLPAAPSTDSSSGARDCCPTYFVNIWALSLSREPWSAKKWACDSWIFLITHYYTLYYIITSTITTYYYTLYFYTVSTSLLHIITFAIIMHYYHSL